MSVQALQEKARLRARGRTSPALQPRPLVRAGRAVA